MFDPLFATPATSRVRVALPVPIHSLFDYAAPRELASEAVPGCRVQVRFGGRVMTGVIVECPTASGEPGGDDAPDELSPLEKVLDSEPALSTSMIRILSEAAAELLCPVGIALAAALPPGSAPRVVRRLDLTPRGSEALARGAVTGNAREVLDALATRPQTASALARKLPAAAALVPELRKDGLVREVQADAGPSAKARSERVVSLCAGIDVESACAGPLARAAKQAELLREIAAHEPVPVERLRTQNSNAPALLRSLRERGLVELGERAAPRDVLGPPVERDTPPALSDEQARALGPIGDAVRDRRFESFLLHGVTGSGKTEVYLRAVEDALEQGRQALLLVPEITLTHQLVARLRARFGDRLAVLHSGLSPGERLEQWQRLRQGDTPIAVGARSALFAPIQDPGVIVIDEEHDSAYKNEEGFRYRAHDLARRRAREAGCPLILGSATPSLETRYESDTGVHQRLVLERRIAGRPLPPVEIVDLAREKEVALPGKRFALTGTLRRALAQGLEDGGQSVLFLNRRGFSTQIYCFDCGHAERCQHCEVALVFHAAEQRLRCHYCDFTKPPPEKCGGCGATGSALLGIGTQRLEEEVRGLHPEARIARLDRDTARRRGYTESVLRDLRAGEIDILIGTQMVAKGHDFPGVRLVGVVAADLGLHMPDFRAAERSFQLLTQVAGRAGRAEHPGRVVLQSFVPDHYAIAPVVTHDYESFYQTEIAFRRALSYPPFGRITQMMLSGPDEGAVRSAAEGLAQGIRPAGGGARPSSQEPGLAVDSPPEYEVLGPAPAPLARLRGQYRYQLLVKGSDRERVRHASEQLSAAMARLPRNVRATLDVNPVSML